MKKTKDLPSEYVIVMREGELVKVVKPKYRKDPVIEEIL